MDGISRETFEQIDRDSKLNVLFDYTVEQYKCVILGTQLDAEIGTN